ncbi:MAG: DUF3995 domain-containing protein [Thermoanaerobaculia bacterium]
MISLEGAKGGPSLQLALASSLALVFAFLGALHVFWAVGGRLGFSSVIPEVNGKRAFTPAPAATLAVALALFLASSLVLGKAGVFGSRAAEHFKWPVFILGFALLMRAVGAGGLVGFTKRVRGTSFARWDTRLFSPLCLALSYGSLWLAFR